MNVVIGTLLVWTAALAALRHLVRHAPHQLPELRMRVRGTLLFLLPRLVVGLIAAGFIAELVPHELVARYLSDDSGLRGIGLGAVAGAVTPGGPLLAFALAASGLKAGAGYGALAAYVTGWSVFALGRTFVYETTMMGPRFTRLRLLVIWPVPLIVGAGIYYAGQV